jgi:hypothetical protein
MVTATPLGLLRPVNGITTADPAAVVDCWGCAADVAADVAVVAPDAGVPAVDAAEAAADIAEEAAVAGVVAPGPDTPVLVQAALPAATTTIATVQAILVN